MCDCSNDVRAPSQSTVLKDTDANMEEILQVRANRFQVNIDLLSSDDLRFLFILLYSVFIVCLAYELS